MAAFGTITSSDIARPGPFARGSSDWHSTPSSTNESCARICACWCVDDAVDGLHRRVGVQRRERQVTGFGDGQRGLDRLEVSHLTDQHHVRVLPQDVLQRCLEALGVGADLALVHHAALVLVQVLDRVLDRDDVLVPLGVDLVDHRRERGRLARARRSGHKHEPARLLRQVRDHLRQSQLVEGLDLVRNRAEGAGHVAALHEDVGAEARELLHAEREVELVRLLEAVLLRVGEHRVAELLGLGRRQRRHPQRMELAVDSELRRGTGGDVKVRGALLDHRLQQLVHVRHGGLPVPSDPPPRCAAPRSAS
jgi:hypothetical protein